MLIVDVAGIREGEDASLPRRRSGRTATSSMILGGGEDAEEGDFGGDHDASPSRGIGTLV